MLALKKACGGNFSEAGGDEATSAVAVGWTWADLGGDDGLGSTAEKTGSFVTAPLPAQ